MTFYHLTDHCINCRENVWKFDHFEAYRTRGRLLRFDCFYCGEDVFLNHLPPARIRELYPEGSDGPANQL